MAFSTLRTLVALAAALLVCGRAEARNPPIGVDPTEGVWIGGADHFIQQSVDRFCVFPAPAAVNKLTVDGKTLWIATGDGVVRFDSGGRRPARLTMDDGLPSQSVSAVAYDDKYLWFATNKGLPPRGPARFHVLLVTRSHDTKNCN